MFEGIGAAVKSYRKANGLTQGAMAKLLNCVQSHVADIEKGGNAPSIPLLVTISEVTGVSVGALLGSEKTGEDMSHKIDVTDLPPSDRAYIAFMVDMLKMDNAEGAKSESALPSTAKGVVYFIHAVELKNIKIGYSANFKTRLDALSTSVPFSLEPLRVIPGTHEDEKAIHRRFAHLRVRREWFQDCPELREYIATL